MAFDGDLILQQENTLLLSSFDSQVAFELGCAIRTHIAKEFPDAPVVIQITAGSSPQVYFFATVAKGSILDNASWVERKRAAVVRWQRSTAGLNVKFGDKGIPAYTNPEGQYACHGGGFPLRVANVEPLVGVVVVSGLKQEDDHRMIVEVLEEFIKKQ